jgi:peroxiredoxin
MKFLLLCFLLMTFAVGGICAEGPGAEPQWQAVLALDAGPPGNAASAEEAHAIALSFLTKQETALREYLAKCPAGAHVVDAQLRLAHVLAIRGDVTNSAASFEAAFRVLEEAAKTAPEARAADLAFARISLIMHRVKIPTENDRTVLSSELASFEKRFPGERRIASLIAEVASLYDDQPTYKKLLLNQALQSATSSEVRARIGDDLKRLAFLGQPVPLQGTAADGTPITLARLRGKVVLVCFFATWSPPSLAELGEVDRLSKLFASSQVAAVGVDLDSTREGFEAVSKATGITWPVLWDGRGWQGPLVRSLSINALPTLWVLDKAGRLRTLNGARENEELVRRLLNEH